MFYRGDVVECIDDNWRNYESPEMNGYGPKKGQILTVAEIINKQPVGVAIAFVEQQWHHIYGGAMAFSAKNFRLLHRKSTETGMAILRGILDGQPIKETIDA